MWLFETSRTWILCHQLTAVYCIPQTLVSFSLPRPSTSPLSSLLGETGLDSKTFAIHTAHVVAGGVVRDLSFQTGVTHGRLMSDRFSLLILVCATAYALLPEGCVSVQCYRGWGEVLFNCTLYNFRYISSPVTKLLFKSNFPSQPCCSEPHYLMRTANAVEDLPHLPPTLSPSAHAKCSAN